MGQNESRPEGPVPIEKGEVGQFKRDAGKWVFEEDIIDVFDDDEVENIVKASDGESNEETLRSDSGFGDGEEEEEEVESRDGEELVV